MGPPGSVETNRYDEWSEKKKSLVLRIQSQVLLIPVPDLRERLTFAAEAMLHPADLMNFEGFTEGGIQILPLRRSTGLPWRILQGRAAPARTLNH
jgi:hypothetical protein